MAKKKVSWATAREFRLPKYYTGVACKQGHFSERWTSNKTCVACERARLTKRAQEMNPAFKKMKSREKNLKDRYGITTADYLRMVEEQGNRCACCSNLTKTLVVDHNHDNDTVRALLCNNCNAMIGFANDTVQLLQLGVDYLVKHS